MLGLLNKSPEFRAFRGSRRCTRDARLYTEAGRAFVLPATRLSRCRPVPGQITGRVLRESAPSRESTAPDQDMAVKRRSQPGLGRFTHTGGQHASEPVLCDWVSAAGPSRRLRGTARVSIACWLVIPQGYAGHAHHGRAIRESMVYAPDQRTPALRQLRYHVKAPQCPRAVEALLEQVRNRCPQAGVVKRFGGLATDHMRADFHLIKQLPGRLTVDLA